MAQAAKCRNMGVVELNIRIRDFEKPWSFHVLADLEYPCILEIYFIGGSKIILDFDRKSLAIQDSQNLSERLGIRHVKTVVYRPQANRTERVNRDLVQMIANYVNEQHDTWDQFLREFAYAIRTAVNETTGKTPAELFLGRKLITPFQKLVMVSDGTEFAVNDWVLVATHPLSSATRKVVAKFKSKFEGPYRVLDVKNNNVVIWKVGKRLTINADQVRIYRHRKCDETEIGTGSLDNGSLRDESSGFDRVQRRSNESRDGQRKGSEVKRELEEKGLSFRNNQGHKISNESRSGGPEMKVQKGSEHRVNKKNLSSNDSNNVLPGLRKKNRKEETVTPTTSGYNLRPRKGKIEESRMTIERKTQQGGPV
ncbi:uncharacterized protein TNCV_2862851 [Trichonephila clavipes]|nr:uncharacterized protein TNCV_2862851 [Trichonephila clavipes]